MSHPSPSPVLAIDPGRHKCGLAVLAGDGRILERLVVPREQLGERLRELAGRHNVAEVVLGDRTGGQSAAEQVQAALPQACLHLVDEHRTSEQARRRYFAEHPPRGWRRLLPTSLQTPPVSIDDWAAVILAERRLRQRNEEGRP